MISTKKQTPTDSISHSVKSALAKLLAGEDITVTHDPSIETAAFAPAERILFLPMWADITKEVYDLLLGHETSHALWTPSDYEGEVNKFAEKLGTNTGAAAMLLNITEDVRIDKMMVKKFPGLRHDYVSGYSELFTRDFFGLGKSGKDISEYPLPDRINIHFKSNPMDIIVPFSEEEMVIVDYLKTMKTWEDVLVGAEMIFEKHEQNKEENPDEGDFGPESQNSGFQLGENDSDEKQDGPAADGDDGDEEQDGPAAGGDDGDEEQDGDDTQDDSSAGAGGDDFGETQKTFNENLNKQVESFSGKVEYCNIPNTVKTLLDTYCSDYKDFWYSRKMKLPFLMDADHTTLKNIQQDAVYMAQQFERYKAAERQKHVIVSKTGRLNMNKIHSHGYSEDIFMKKDILRDSKNHGFVFILDWSGSMVYDIKGTLQQMARMTTFCKQVGIPYDVYTFRTTNTYSLGDDEKKLKPVFTNNIGDILFNNEFLIDNILSSRMKNKEYEEAIKRLLFAPRSIPNFNMGSTPLNQSIVLSEYLVDKFIASSGVDNINIVYLTDGDSDSHTGVLTRDGSVTRSLFGDKTLVIRKNNFTSAIKGYQGGWSGGGNFTSSLLEIMKEYIATKYPEKNFNTMGMFLDPKMKVKDGPFFEKENYLGYDTHYKLNRKLFSNNTEVEWDMKATPKMNMKKMSMSKKHQRTLTETYMKKMMAFDEKSA